jgi:uncharacterized membrane protein
MDVNRLHPHTETPFGGDRFGRLAESVARGFGTPVFIILQTIVVAFWIALNATALIARWDPYPFILLNLMFSTQAAYAAPMILLAQTRQSDRDKAQARLEASHREEIAREHAILIIQNTKLTKEVAELTRSIDTKISTLGAE